VNFVPSSKVKILPDLPEVLPNVGLGPEAVVGVAEVLELAVLEVELALRFFSPIPSPNPMAARTTKIARMINVKRCRRFTFFSESSMGPEWGDGIDVKGEGEFHSPGTYNP